MRIVAGAHSQVEPAFRVERAFHHAIRAEFREQHAAGSRVMGTGWRDGRVRCSRRRHEQHEDAAIAGRIVVGRMDAERDIAGPQRACQRRLIRCAEARAGHARQRRAERRDRERAGRHRRVAGERAACRGRQRHIAELPDRRTAAVEIERVGIPAPLLGRHLRREQERAARAFEHGGAGLQLVAQHRRHVRRAAFEARMHGALPLLAHQQRDAERQRRTGEQRSDASHERLA
ncbi:hypothetical protein BamMEX5DRAFT_6382 [Burkholderia ambifaria MEX-5]|uniref:Uncharacterized protein n=1 Tax=Burkholderia ambifaria MEX-5 TaxID=396597 RepID=B1TF16_9BURK|nr:hypothetical protein BamMEX5DRAFT_6382 [Burkholderia ambifaria MEX-5]